ncbi:hypothetical protein M0R45_007429 [Rubus argutus]|uniref:Secreted protein n=1 Tax=Rubus argutus TaxID=59490 RepID=A0AAW1XYQ0_RUBAR
MKSARKRRKGKQYHLLCTSLASIRATNAAQSSLTCAHPETNSPAWTCTVADAQSATLPVVSASQPVAAVLTKSAR